jgi:hypothetical protein
MQLMVHIGCSQDGDNRHKEAQQLALPDQGQLVLPLLCYLFLDNLLITKLLDHSEEAHC